MTLPIVSSFVLPRTGLRLVDWSGVTRLEQSQYGASMVDLLQIRILDKLRPGQRLCSAMNNADMLANGCDINLPMLHLIAFSLSSGAVRGGFTVHNIIAEDETARVVRVTGKPVPHLYGESLSIEDTWVAVHDHLIDFELRAEQGRGIAFEGWDLHTVAGHEWVRDADESRVEPELRGIGGQVIARVAQGRTLELGPNGEPLTIRGRRGP